jgi:hypothetical protein
MIPSESARSEWRRRLDRNRLWKRQVGRATSTVPARRAKGDSFAARHRPSTSVVRRTHSRECARVRPTGAQRYIDCLEARLVARRAVGARACVADRARSAISTVRLMVPENLLRIVSENQRLPRRSATGEMLTLLERHRIQVLMDAEFSAADVAKRTGFSLDTVRRVQRESAVTHTDDKLEHRQRRIGRPCVAAPFARRSLAGFERSRTARPKSWDQCCTTTTWPTPSSIASRAGPLARAGRAVAPHPPFARTRV